MKGMTYTFSLVLAATLLEASSETHLKSKKKSKNKIGILFCGELFFSAGDFFRKCQGDTRPFLKWL